MKTDRGGFETSRSDKVQLTGIKPKALEFASPLKNDSPKYTSTVSTKDQTASAKPFGLSNCVFKCESNGNSPNQYKFDHDEDPSDKLKIQK